MSVIRLTFFAEVSFVGRAARSWSGPYFKCQVNHQLPSHQHAQSQLWWDISVRRTQDVSRTLWNISQKNHVAYCSSPHWGKLPLDKVSHSEVTVYRYSDHQIQYYWCQWSLFNSRLPKVCLFWVTTIDYQSPCDRQSYHKISSTWTLHPHSWIKERKINEMNEWNNCCKGNTSCEWSWWWESCPGCCDESVRKLKL